jgi:predicted HNH restriction endonuclease
VKKSNVSDMANQSYSFKTIQEEIDKCEVRCANCHRIVTHERRQEEKESVEQIQEEMALDQLSMNFG